jgi:preprotein translocase subunit SecF
MILAGVCITVAGFFIWRRNFDAAFVVAALGLVAWFLNYRAQMKEIVVAANLRDKVSEEEEESVEEDSDH